MAASQSPGKCRLYAAGTSNNHKVAIALAELGMPHELHKIDLAKGEQSSPEFLELNPAGRTPVLVDGGCVLPESGAILFYLAERDPQHRLLPGDAASRAQALSWVFYQGAHVSPHDYVVVTGRVFGYQYDEPVMKAAEKQILAAFKLLDGRVAKTGAWLAGDQFTIADVACVSSVLCETSLLGIDLPTQFPSLAAWLDRALARPAVIKGLNTPDPNPFLAKRTGAGQGGAEVRL